VVIDGRTEIGPGSRIFPFATLGFEGQDTKSTESDTRLVIGANTVIREHCTIHRGTPGGGGTTRVGDNGYFMVNSHVAHDCHLGNHVVFANNATVAGHVTVGDHAILGGNSGVHQFVRIGHHAMLGGLSGAENDIIPYGLVYGNRDGLSGLNFVGLKRRGFNRKEISELRRAYRVLFEGDGTMAERLAAATSEFADNAHAMEIIDFINADSSRPIMMARPNRAR
jgi:UDP-N-acetylglucosamine acyltransferase